EYESYYYFKFNKQPKLVRKAESGETNSKSIKPRPLKPIPKHQHPSQQLKEEFSKHGIASDGYPNIAPAHSPPLIPKIPRNDLKQTIVKESHEPVNTPSTQQTKDSKVKTVPSINKATEKSDMEGIVGMNVNNAFSSKKEESTAINNNKDQAIDYTKRELIDDFSFAKLLKPFPDYVNSEYRELASIITRDIYVKNPDVRWADIAGLHAPKRLMKEAVVYPMKYPQLFKGILSPWKGVLLYGPPGTGKTMLAKAVATECKTTFFNISASSIVSKWRGDSEKLVRVLFDLARHHAPSTIFLDELESIMSHRSSDGGEHEGSRRMKTELLIQLDGLAKTTDHVFLLAASNMPWDLDIAMLRRLEKRILIDLPDLEARLEMFRENLQPSIDNIPISPDIDYHELAKLTDGYSGSDIKLICKEAAMKPLRALFDAIEAAETPDSNSPYFDPVQLKLEKEFDVMTLERQPVSMGDIMSAIESTKPSCDKSISKKYIQWQEEHGSV
ncbi:Katanin p60 ATPase-containing subunit A-like 2, partial [Nowakowskiella sp. JEL0407]